jgi:hypothetical protein
VRIDRLFVSRSFRFVSIAALTMSLSGCGFLPITRLSSAGAEVLEQAPKPPPVDSAFGGCGESGSQPDYVLNRRKNRVDEGQYIPISWQVLARLPWPRRVGYRFRNQWTAGETKDVARYEGVAVEVEGYVTDYKLEFPEPPNCYSTDAGARDFHVWLTEAPHQDKRESVVIEITPRVRVSHTGWSEQRLAALVEMQARVRIRGWLMLDQMHPESMPWTRFTLWEIHPIMQIHWRSSRDAWVSLDSLSPAADSGAERRPY